MAETNLVSPTKASETCYDDDEPLMDLISIRSLAESPGLTVIPSKYVYHTSNPRDDDHHQVSYDDGNPIPVIDYALLTFGTPNQRHQIVQQLRQACLDWGFFTVVNHGVPESLMKRMINVVEDFFNLTDEEKKEFTNKNVLDPIRCGTSFNPLVDKVFSWKDFLKVIVHPHFHSPSKPPTFREVSEDYTRRVRQVARELLRGISESLGLEKNYIDETLKLEYGLQVLAANFYPPCPQPQLAMGMVPHSDHGLLTLLIQNGVDGLQVKHKHNWINVNATPNAFLVNVGDHLEILSNGQYKSVLHRAVVNSKSTRISIAMAHGPCLDEIIVPAPELVASCESKRRHAAYIGMKYRDYLLMQQGNNLEGKSGLDRVRV